MQDLLFRVCLCLALVGLRTIAQVQTISVGGPLSQFPTLTSAVSSLPAALPDDVNIVVEVGPNGLAEPGLEIDSSRFGSLGHGVIIEGISKPAATTQTDITYYVGDEVEYRVDPSGNVQTIFNFGSTARQVHDGQGVDEPKDFQIRDHLGSVVTSVNEAGNPNGTLLEYDAFGRQEIIIAAPAPKLTQSFTGKEFDILDPSDVSSPGLYHFGARTYDPDIAIWISPDPARQFASPYSYSPNPVNSVDPDGRQSIEAAINYSFAQSQQKQAVNFVQNDLPVYAAYTGLGVGGGLALTPAGIAMAEAGLVWGLSGAAGIGVAAYQGVRAATNGFSNFVTSGPSIYNAFTAASNFLTNTANYLNGQLGPDPVTTSGWGLLGTINAALFATFPDESSAPGFSLPLDMSAVAPDATSVRRQ